MKAMTQLIIWHFVYQYSFLPPLWVDGGSDGDDGILSRAGDDGDGDDGNDDVIVNRTGAQQENRSSPISQNRLQCFAITLQVAGVSNVRKTANIWKYFKNMRQNTAKYFEIFWIIILQYNVHGFTGCSDISAARCYLIIYIYLLYLE